jgi:hypothetical protein
MRRLSRCFEVAKRKGNCFYRRGAEYAEKVYCNRINTESTEKGSEGTENLERGWIFGGDDFYGFDG